MAVVDPAGIAPLHTPQAHAVIAAELVACTLGQRRHADRLELRVDALGRILVIARRFDEVKMQIGLRLIEALRPLARHLQSLEAPRSDR